MGRWGRVPAKGAVGELVDVAIPVEQGVASLSTVDDRGMIGRLVRRMRPRAEPSRFMAALAEWQRAAGVASLTEAEVEAELTAQ